MDVSLPVGAESSSSPRLFVTLIRASFATTIAVLPVFLLGALAVFIRRELGFSETLLGSLVSVWYILSSVTSVWGGRLTERLGAGRAMAVAGMCSIVSLLGIAVVAQAWWHLIPFLLIGSLGNAIAHPTANLSLARDIPVARMGFAFGVKQSAVPLASVLGGFAVPAIGLTLGWRYAFGLAALLAGVFVFSLPKTQRRPPDAPRRPDRTGDIAVAPLVILGLAGGLGTMATNPLAIFYVEGAVAHGFSAALAGSALALGSMTAIVFRVIWGLVADRWSGSRLTLVSLLTATGAVGLVLLGQARSLWMLGLATLLAFAVGWGWAGLFQFAVVKINPAAPAEATGIVMTFMRLGGILGPLTIGALAERTNYGFTWFIGGVILLCSSLMIQVARVTIRRDIRSRAPVAAQGGGVG
jgi:MFS family permease